MKKIGLIILVSSWFFSCEEQIVSELPTEQLDVVVVESVLTNELRPQVVRLTRPYNSQNEDPTPVTGAFVVIGDSDDNFEILREFPRNSGIYISNPMRAVFGKTYFLLIRHDGKEYTAFDASPIGQPLPPIIIEENDTETHPYSLGFEEFGRVPNYVEHRINWINSPACDTDCFGLVTFYDLKTVDVQETFAPQKDDFFFPSGTRIIRKKYSVSPRYQEYLRSLLSETEWRGGVFDIERDNVKTNLSEGAIGFFAVTTVVTDTVFVR